jgi:23S rRNA pseudouridine1911/1915/1917 synthase
VRPGSSSRSTDSPPEELVVAEAEAGTRLERFLAERLAVVARGAIRRMIERGEVLVDGRRGAKGLRLVAGSRVRLLAGALDESPIPEPEAPLRFLAVLEELVAIDKPAGVHGHPLRPGERGTVANALVARFPECALASPSPREAGLLHRLDWSTSGVLLAARSREAHERLRGAIGSDRAVKRYLALAAGAIEGPRTMRSFLRPAAMDPSRVEVADGPGARGAGPREAVTTVRPLERLGGLTLCEAVIGAGQRHQIRVHLAHAGHPIAGDARYGGPPITGAEGAFLHAASLDLGDGAPRFEAELPEERRALIEALRDCRARPPDETPSARSRG